MFTKLLCYNRQVTLTAFLCVHYIEASFVKSFKLGNQLCLPIEMRQRLLLAFFLSPLNENQLRDFISLTMIHLPNSFKTLTINPVSVLNFWVNKVTNHLSSEDTNLDKGYCQLVTVLALILYPASHTHLFVLI